jgi:hypothetical protein
MRARQAQAARANAGRAEPGAGEQDDLAAAHGSPAATARVQRWREIAVPAELLQKSLEEYTRRNAAGAPARLTTVLLDQVAAFDLSGDPMEIAVAARLRILALACVVRDRLLDDWVRRDAGGGMVLFHNSLFAAAAVEPLIVFPPDQIGFDPESLRRNALGAAVVKGSA